MTIWLGTAALVAIDPSLPLKQTILLNSVASVIVALLGFTSPRR